MNKTELQHAIRAIGLALNTPNNCLTTDVPEVVLDDNVSWRINNNNEIMLLKQIEDAVNSDTCLLCGHHNNAL
jgi:hypothetical protein